MEPKFQSSFIPKKPVVDSPKMAGPVEKNVNIFSAIATILFLLTLICSAGVFGYLKYVERNISTADKQLVEVRSAFQESRIQDLIDASIKLNVVKNLLEQHYVTSRILVMLQDLTLKNVRFDSMSYSNTNGKPTVTFQSEAIGYNAVANQKEVFEGSKKLDDVQFSDFKLTPEGSVSTKMVASVSASLISYKDFINSAEQDIQE